MRISDWSSDVCSSDLVAQRIADRPRMRKVDVVAAGNIVEHARPGFAACAVVVGAVRTNEYGIDAAPGAGQFADRKSVMGGKSVSVRVDLGGRRIIKTKK